LRLIVLATAAGFACRLLFRALVARSNDLRGRRLRAAKGEEYKTRAARPPRGA
jgi:hypothetical protein